MDAHGQAECRWWTKQDRKDVLQKVVASNPSFVRTLTNRNFAALSVLSGKDCIAMYWPSELNQTILHHRAIQLNHQISSNVWIMREAAVLEGQLDCARCRPAPSFASSFGTLFGLMWLFWCKLSLFVGKSMRVAGILEQIWLAVGLLPSFYLLAFVRVFNDFNVFWTVRFHSPVLIKQHWRSTAKAERCWKLCFNALSRAWALQKPSHSGSTFIGTNSTTRILSVNICQPSLKHWN